jgi:hypothetical protein
MKSIKSGRVVKQLGYGIVALSWIAGIGLPQSLENSRKIDALIAAGALQRQQHDYESAWRSLGQALQADPDSAKVHSSQEDLAMEWLESIDVPSAGLSNIIDSLEPALIRGVVASPSSSRQSDLLAHVGWSYYLRSRERFDLDPARAYAEAVKRDANNPYAHAMWGHWVLWQGGPLSDARQRFSLALASGRLRAYVNRLQLAGFRNGAQVYEAGEILRAANVIRKEQGTPDHETQRYIFSKYYSQLHSWNGQPNAETKRFLNAVPPTEHIALFRWLFDGYALSEDNSLFRTFYLSALEEAAGQFGEALAGYRLIQQQEAARSWRGSLLDAAESGIRRLSGTSK